MVVLVTGSRSGIGRATALSAGRAGHKVYAGFRDLSTKDQLMKDADGMSIVPVQLDITNPEDREAVQDQILAAEGYLDVLVNNAWSRWTRMRSGACSTSTSLAPGP